MTVTREPADRARTDARRAAQAVRLARRSHGPAGTPEDLESVEPADAPTTAVSLAKPAPVGAEPEATPDDDTAIEAEPAAAEADASAAADVDADADVDTDTDTNTATDTDGEPTRTRRRARGVTVLATVFAVLAAAFLVVAIVVHAKSPRTESPAGARDSALLAARQDIVVLNTLDFNDVDGGLQRWLGATTGTIHDQLSSVTAADKQAIAASKSVTTASVLAAAVTQVDTTRGSATVIASVQVDVKPQTGTATTKRTRFSITMSKVGETWKIGAIQQVGVTLS